jgi:hypothetical protein
MPLKLLRHVLLEASHCIFPVRKIGGLGLMPVGGPRRVGLLGRERVEWCGACEHSEGVKSAAVPG